ncbi:SDR family oxidoreductase [Ectopseudomonas mendocina]|uniref:SDR family oxidoreductase n=2 Tax=Ectopseudomonas mendocina TaxID=300 RepID=A0ABD7RTJ5_ECTME|nr:SDR family oxidoreductase [Pseudomonas mendocina]ALN18962.1 short-chain dehydrogenase [Pseudomonas mendocina S5.2]KES00175.1 short-chain dehydrogenase [Pseudomonas mendocina]TRO11880.1 SDR family oxidoreductase [Pseudomonas mendocina]TRO13855.1 SDR family oxidoreductase [Pseudomonas mendocina]
MGNILISGAASGIGAATARLFHARGWRVGLLDVDANALVALAAELDDAWHSRLDVVDAAAVQAALAEFCAHSGGQLRLLFNGAGILHTGAFADIELEQHTRLVEINVLGVLNLCHAAFPYLKATPEAQVINMGSASALYGVPQLACYSASKFAIRGLTEALELEWREHGIRVGDLMPPFVDTPMVRSQAQRPAVMHRLGVRLEAEQIAEAAWQQAQRNLVHRPVGVQFGVLFNLGQIAPGWLNRLLMGWLSR